MHVIAPPQSEQSPPLDHRAVQPAGLSSSLSRTVPSAGVPAFASLGDVQLAAFPSLIRPFTNTNLTSGFRQSQQHKSWASVAALSASDLSSFMTTSTRMDGARQLPMLSGAQRQQSPSSVGTSADADADADANPNAVPEFYDKPSRPPRTWASLASSDLSAWTPNWNMGGGDGEDAAISARMGTGLQTPTFARGSEWSEVTMGKKGKGKQRQRLV